jgi:pyruvate-formate lyase-activating enzyme
MKKNNFCWMATWKITDRCNLHCTYCDPTIMKRANESENINRFEALDRIAVYKPRILNISGGEPALVKELPGLLSRAKAVWNPHIRVVHNGTDPQKLSEAFPCIDRLVISADGPGDVNAATRGISGDAVLGKIAALINSAGPVPEITINTVVTEKNINTLKDFAAQITSVSPNITLALLPVMPLDSDLSVLKDREAGYERFAAVYADIKAAHGDTVHNLDCVMRHKNLRKIQCYNQYFTVKFSPRGEPFTCGAPIVSQLRRSDRAYKKVFKKGGLRKLFTMAVKSVKAKFGAVDFTCRNICNCESWLDTTFLGEDTGYAPVVLRGFRGRLTKDDYAELDEFVKKHINADFDVEWFRAKVEGGPE